MKYFLLSILLCQFVSGYAQNGNDMLQNKTYTREVGSVCKSFADGGCLIATFEEMRFSPDSVYINQYTKADCDVPVRNAMHEQRTGKGAYSYQVQKKKNSPNRIVRIDGYRKGSWELEGNVLREFSPTTANGNGTKIVFNRTK